MQWYDYYLYFYCVILVLGMAANIWYIGRERDPLTAGTVLFTMIVTVPALIAILIKLGE